MLTVPCVITLIHLFTTLSFLACLYLVFHLPFDPSSPSSLHLQLCPPSLSSFFHSSPLYSCSIPFTSHLILNPFYHTVLYSLTSLFILSSFPFSILSFAPFHLSSPSASFALYRFPNHYLQPNFTFLLFLFSCHIISTSSFSFPFNFSSFVPFLLCFQLYFQPFYFLHAPLSHP